MARSVSSSPAVRRSWRATRNEARGDPSTRSPAGSFTRATSASWTSSGWFYLVDRKKDQIDAAGYKVWPREVEDVLYGHPAVNEAAVVGVPDSYRGETVKAFVSLKGGQTAEPAELVAYCKERMAAYKYPRSIEIIAELPKTASGKILRRELRERAAAHVGQQW